MYLFDLIPLHPLWIWILLHGIKVSVDNDARDNDRHYYFNKISTDSDPL